MLAARQARFEQLAHGRQGIGIKQRSHPLPQPALAAQRCPHRLQQGATPLLGLIRMAFSLATTLVPQSHEDDWNTLILSGKMEAPPRF